METDIKNQQVLALKQYAFNVSTPLFQAIGEDADHLGTGSFVEKNGKTVLLTARHVIDECEPENIAIADSPLGSTLFTIGSAIIHKPKDLAGADIDILAIEILEPSVIEKIRSGWRVVDVSAGGHESFGMEKTLVGYPSERLSKEGSSLVGKPVAFLCKPLDAIPQTASMPVNPELDIFLDYPKEALDSGDRSVDLHYIKGMSGCAIWEWRNLPVEEIWTPERALCLIGIQSAAAKGNFVRGKKWRYISELLRAV